MQSCMQNFKIGTIQNNEILWIVFFKLHFLMKLAIRTSALISPVFTCEMASASRRTCNIRCFMQLFVVNMIARPIWAKDVKFGVHCFCLGYL